mgnify:FL=1
MVLRGLLETVGPDAGWTAETRTEVEALGRDVDALIARLGKVPRPRLPVTHLPGTRPWRHDGDSGPEAG